MSTYFDSQIIPFMARLRAAGIAKPWLILLEGDLGAGKTTWTQEFVAALGADNSDVKSPTFLKLLAHDVPKFGQLLHIDAYRIENPEEFLRMGLESYENIAALVVEWPRVFLDFLETYPDYKSLLGIREAITLRFAIDPNQSTRVTAEEFTKLI